MFIKSTEFYVIHVNQ